MIPQLDLARRLALKAHAGQFRRDGVTPYIEHCRAVAKRLERESGEVQAVAWLHDVCEDTDMGPQSLLDAGIHEDIVHAVAILTKRQGEPYVNYLAAVRNNAVARKVKIADMLHNLSDSPTEKQIIKYCQGLLYLVSN